MYHLTLTITLTPTAAGNSVHARRIAHIGPITTADLHHADRLTAAQTAKAIRILADLLDPPTPPDTVSKINNLR